MVMRHIYLNATLILRRLKIVKTSILVACELKRYVFTGAEKLASSPGINWSYISPGTAVLKKCEDALRL